MGLLWRFLAPKPLKKLRRGAFKVAHPVEALEYAAGNQIARGLRKRSGRSAHRTARDSNPQREPWTLLRRYNVEFFNGEISVETATVHGRSMQEAQTVVQGMLEGRALKGITVTHAMVVDRLAPSNATVVGP
jgi:hypothetical protein